MDVLAPIDACRGALDNRHIMAMFIEVLGDVVARNTTPDYHYPFASGRRLCTRELRRMAKTRSLKVVYAFNFGNLGLTVHSGSLYDMVRPERSHLCTSFLRVAFNCYLPPFTIPFCSL